MHVELIDLIFRREEENLIQAIIHDVNARGIDEIVGRFHHKLIREFCQRLSGFGRRRYVQSLRERAERGHDLLLPGTGL